MRLRAVQLQKAAFPLAEFLEALSRDVGSPCARADFPSADLLGAERRVLEKPATAGLPRELHIECSSHTPGRPAAGGRVSVHSDAQ